ncbi:hypothetical protein M9H77_26813 [Catharanthus roseus]|uniref:Uncharacterized protein n=1 Tax=Catharanthus roseus TaxID=4058 RepID=A0ACC0ACA7_CATRO|nr:hypothetical protein M9H77_26813 [Catharanthus roseus]
MEYYWSISSWQWTEDMRKQEDYQSKLPRDMYNYYHGGGNEVNAYGRSNHGHENFISKGHDCYGNFTPERHYGVDNFSSHAKSYGNTSYDDYGDRQLSMPSQGVAKVEPFTPSMVDEFQRIKELPQAKTEKSLETHIEKEISNEDSSDNMNEKSIEKEECFETKEKDKVEQKKERLVERFCISNSISVLSKESKYFEYSKEKEYELEKSERTNTLQSLEFKK